jgi:pimeloyl-ACP methyl ester carboxylesterase
VDRVTSVFYLHGFASSPRSTKAGYFAERLRAHGLTLQTPDFNEPDFRTLTMTRMLESMDRALGRSPSPATLIGSSLGGTLAVLAAARFDSRIDRLVLLAPAVMFAKPGHHLLPPDRVQEWRQRGALPFFHYAYDADRLLDVAFYEDSLAHDAFAAVFGQPALVFQGLHDQSVDCRTVEAFANARPNVVLSLVDDDHQLVASLPRIWQDVEPFLGLID